MINVYEQIDRNKRKSTLVIAFFILFVVLTVYLFSRFLEISLSWVGLALIFAGLTSLGGYYWGDKVILTISGARPASKKKRLPVLYGGGKSLFSSSSAKTKTLCN